MRAFQQRARRSTGAGSRFGFGVAVAFALVVAGIGGVTSFEAVSAAFGSPLVPLVADGMIIACTALRLAAMSRGWTIPGAMFTTYVFIVGSIVINAASVEGWAAKLGHALAPLAYAIIVEMLAHLLRQHMGLIQPRQERRLSALMSARWSALTWLTSPVITTRVWLHLARTGGDDPVAARALMQQLVRVSSRLAAVCPTPAGWRPMLRARAARTAVLRTIRDGLLSARDVALLLPDDDRQLSPGQLLARLDRATITLPTSDPAVGRVSGELHRPVHTAVAAPVHRPAAVSASAPVQPGASGSASEPATAAASVPAPAVQPPAVAEGAPPDGDDAALVGWLHRHAAAHNDGEPLSARAVMKLLSSGWPRAKRIHELAGWNDTTDTDQTAETKTEPRQLQLIPNTSKSEPNEPSDSESELEESRA
ncbi:hypothetical protein BKA15_003220 [Microlunatus parietis]|uniref:DUF2637 domain-containing protein n=1 Tax=Microlunatus parietis TaxID=682979 RepID=A0A7Y9I7R9_9ACTN|nr:DUF2637 domain-containing protein [Microlunatus parietis]NYE71891.1 hypothetical protein [Microlunatus parietis]